jgi:hypothetical protein
MNTLTDAGYDICTACIFFVDDIINIHDLKRDFMLVYNCSLVISTSTLVQESILPNQVRVIFYILFGIISEKIWRTIKTTAPIKYPGIKY